MWHNAVIKRVLILLCLNILHKNHEHIFYPPKNIITSYCTVTSASAQNYNFSSLSR